MQKKIKERHFCRAKKNDALVHCNRKEKKHCKNARDYEFNFRKED